MRPVITREAGSDPLETGRRHVREPVTRWAERTSWIWVPLRAIWRNGITRWSAQSVTGLAVVTIWARTGSLAVALSLAVVAWALIGVILLAPESPGRASALAGPRASVIGLSRRKRVRRAWGYWCATKGLSSPHAGKPLRRHRLRRTPTGLAVRVHTAESGRTAGEVADRVYSLAAFSSVDRAWLGARHRLLGPGNVRQARARQLAPAELEIRLDWDDLLAADVLMSMLNTPKLAPQVGRLVLGITEDGEAATLGLGRSILIGGEVGGGKSTLLHMIVLDMLRSGVPFRLRIIDPKGGVELGMYDPERGGMAYEYTRDPKEAGAILERWEKGMHKRLATMRRMGITQWVPTKDDPLDILVCDEFLMTDIDTEIAGPAAQGALAGRAAGYFMIFLTQLGHAEATGLLRNLIPYRICFASPTWQVTDTILGSGAEARGAKCSRISKEQRGQGYLRDEDVRGYFRFKGVWIPDEAKHAIGRGELPPEVLPLNPTRQRRTAPGWVAPGENSLGILDEPEGD